MECDVLNKDARLLSVLQMFSEVIQVREYEHVWVVLGHR